MKSRFIASLAVFVLALGGAFSISVQAQTTEWANKLVKGGDLAEDEGKKALEKVRSEVDAGVKKVDDVIAGKEKDLMQV